MRQVMLWEDKIFSSGNRKHTYKKFRPKLIEFARLMLNTMHDEQAILVRKYTNN